MLRLIILMLLFVPKCWPDPFPEGLQGEPVDRVRLSALPHPDTFEGAPSLKSLKVPAESTVPEVEVLVSLSLSDPELVQLFRAVHPIGGVLVFRGIPAEGMQAMQQHLRSLAISAQIDPWWFAFYKVQQVPTWIVPILPFHRGFQHPGNAVELSGLLDVHTVLELMRRNVQRPEAQKYLSALEERSGYDGHE